MAVCSLLKPLTKDTKGTERYEFSRTKRRERKPQQMRNDKQILKMASRQRAWQNEGSYHLKASKGGP